MPVAPHGDDLLGKVDALVAARARVASEIHDWHRSSTQPASNLILIIDGGGGAERKGDQESKKK